MALIQELLNNLYREAVSNLFLQEATFLESQGPFLMISYALHGTIGHPMGHLWSNGLRVGDLWIDHHSGCHPIGLHVCISWQLCIKMIMKCNASRPWDILFLLRLSFNLIQWTQIRCCCCCPCHWINKHTASLSEIVQTFHLPFRRVFCTYLTICCNRILVVFNHFKS